MRRRWSRYVLVALGLVAVIGLLGGIKFWQISSLVAFGKSMAAAGPPPESVGSAVATKQTWELTLSAVGSVTGIESVALSAEQPGTVTKLRFESGDRVEEGQVLVELDTSAERAQLSAAIARRDRAKLTATRQRNLFRAGAVARADLDDAETALATAEQDVKALRAQAEYKVIRAPFTGRTGIRTVNLGQYLAPGTAITTLTSTGGVFVDFALPQEQLSVVRVGTPVRASVRAGAGQQAHPEQFEGTITAIDPTVDPATRNLRVRATIAKHADKLRAGMFVTVEVVLPQQTEVVAIPVTAVVHAPYGSSVYVIEDKPAGSPGMATTPEGKPVKLARQRFVKLGPMRGDFVAVVEGLAPGAQVVSAGAFKLRNNAPIVIDNRVQPKAELAPHPENR